MEDREVKKMNDFEKFDSIINKFDNLIEQFTEMKAEVEKARAEVSTKVNIVYGYHVEDVTRKNYCWYTNEDIEICSLVLADTYRGNQLVKVTNVAYNVCLEEFEKRYGLELKKITGVFNFEPFNN